MRPRCLFQINWRCTICEFSPLTVTTERIRCPMCGNHYPLKNSLWECAADYTPSGFSIDQLNPQHLLDIEQEHFWFAPRDQLLRSKLLTLKRPSDQRLLELGCGSGRVLATLETEFPHSVGIEGHLKALKRAFILSIRQLFKVRMAFYSSDGVGRQVFEYIDGSKQIVSCEEWDCMKLMKHHSRKYRAEQEAEESIS